MLKSFRIRVEGPRALWMDPNTRGEPRSYPAPTPSAVKGVFKSIYGKPEIEWVVERITVVNPPRFESVTYRMDKNVGVDDRYAPYGNDVGKTLQTWTFLRDVKYEFQARFEVLSAVGVTDDNTPLQGSLIDKYEGSTKFDVERIYRAKIMDRMENGRHFRAPTLGKNECPALWEHVPLQSPLAIGCSFDWDGVTLLDNVPISIQSDNYDSQFVVSCYRNGVWDLTCFEDIVSKQHANLSRLVKARLDERNRRKTPFIASRSRAKAPARSA